MKEEQRKIVIELNKVMCLFKLSLHECEESLTWCQYDTTLSILVLIIYGIKTQAENENMTDYRSSYGAELKVVCNRLICLITEMRGDAGAECRLNHADLIWKMLSLTEQLLLD